jgi:Zn-dependent protease with chaperone function
MLVVVAMALGVVLLVLDAQPRPMRPWQAALVPVCYLLVAAGLAATRSALALRQLRGASRKVTVLLRLVTAAEPLWLLGGLALVTAQVTHPVVASLRLRGAVATAAGFVPFVAAVLLIWVLDYPIHRRLRAAASGAPAAPAWTRLQYLVYNFRHHVLLGAAPVLLILLSADAIGHYGPQALMRLKVSPQYWATIQHGVSGAAAAVVFVLVPLMMIRIWRTAPLPAGELRDSLLEVQRRLGVRCRDIRVWLSRRVIANACVVGLIRPVRYVLLSDGLLDRMEPAHVRAVFAHEAAHVMRRHLPYLAMFAISSAVLCGALAAELSWLLPAAYQRLAADWGAIVPLAAAWYWGFGYVSRRFERQSDVTAAWCCGGGNDARAVTPEGAATFAAALSRVAALSGIAPDAPNWRHGSIRRRINYLIFLGSTGGTCAPIDRTVRRIKLVLWVMTALAISATWRLWR